jgi:hypothetical protein
VPDAPIGDSSPRPSYQHCRGVVIYAIQPHQGSPQAGVDGPVDDLPGFATSATVSADNRITFAQATPDGLRDVTIVWARGPAPRPAADDREVTMADGRRFVAQRLAIAASGGA